MKQIIFYLLILPSFVFAQEGSYKIKGSFKGMPDKTELVIKNEEISPEPLANFKSNGESFEVTGKLKEPGLYYLTANNGAQRLFIFLDASSIKIEGDWATFQNSQVSGSNSHNDFIAFNGIFNPLFSRLSGYAQQLNQGTQDPDGSIRKNYNDVVAEVSKQTDQFINSHQNSPVSPFVLLVLMQLNDDPKLMEDRMARIAPGAKENHFGRTLNKAIADAKFGAIGTPAPDFAQQDTDGKDVKLSSFRGKYVLIDFWASWCGPCRQENPNVVSAFQKYNSKNFTVLGVSLDRAKDPWLKAIKDDQLSWTHVSDLKFWSNAVAVQYKVQSIPQNYLVDPNGLIIAKNLRGDQLHAKLEELLK